MTWFLLIQFFIYNSVISQSYAQDALEPAVDQQIVTKLHRINCSDLRIGQFKCPPVRFDYETEQPVGCTADNLAPIRCELRPGLICDNTLKSGSGNLSLPALSVGPSPMSSISGPEPWNTTHYVDLAVSCQYTNGYSLETALLFSVFLGMFGVDRFYLGYPAIGLLKFCTLGFLFLGQFVDIILIAMQIVRPADGSNYIVKHYGARINIINSFQTDLVQASTARLVIDSFNDIYYYPLDS